MAKITHQQLGGNVSGEEWRTAAIGLLSVVCALLGWWGNVVWSAVKEMRKEHEQAVDRLRGEGNRLAVHLAENFVRKDDLKDRLQEVLAPLKESLDDIKASLRGQGK